MKEVHSNPNTKFTREEMQQVTTRLANMGATSRPPSSRRARWRLTSARRSTKAEGLLPRPRVRPREQE